MGSRCLGLSFGAAGGANVRDPLALLCRTFSMLRCEVVTSLDRRARVVASSQPLRVSLCSFQPWSYCCVMGFTGIPLSSGIFLVICYLLFSACFFVELPWVLVYLWNAFVVCINKVLGIEKEYWKF